MPLHIDMRKNPMPAEGLRSASAAGMANEAEQQHLANLPCRGYKKAPLLRSEENIAQAAAGHIAAQHIATRAQEVPHLARFQL
ncbi:hypothetical protein ACIPEN_10035 [Herbaspirillum chlorophenolicum]|uniref:Uncharacterized protein n=1 Tax=Herbaspirillum chlorophenolicum TaxID=211589 RepID=A0ABW8EZ46_9BURK